MAILMGHHLLQWASNRQSFVTLSTAEGELVGCGEVFQAGQSVSSLVEIFEEGEGPRAGC